MTTQPMQTGAFLTPTGVLQIRQIDLDDPAIAAEACRWTSAVRGEPRTLDESAGANVEAFVKAAMSIGTEMLGHASDANIAGLASQVSTIAERAESASAALIRRAGEAAEQSTATAARATRDASEATARTLAAAIKQFEQDSERTLNARVAVVDERLKALLGGEGSEVANAVRVIVSAALADSQAGWQASASATLAEMQRVFDPANPTNPLAVATRKIDESQSRHHAELGARMDRVAELVAATAGAAASNAVLMAAQAHSPAKGRPFEHAVACSLETVAAGLGASFERTGHVVGAVRNSRKGDAVVELPTTRDAASPARVLIEITTQESRRDWLSYLRDAEKNRNCQVSLGIVRCTDQVPGGEPMALLGPTRAVVAYDPDTDSPALMRAVLQLLAVEATRRVETTVSTDLGLVDSKIVSARQQLAELVALHKLATGVRDNAGKVVTGLDSLHAAMTQTLDQALSALRSALPVAA
jgi:hypothetical protein